MLASRMMEKAEINTSERTFIICHQLLLTSLSIIVLFLYIDMLNEAGRHQEVADLIRSPRGDVCKMPMERTLIELDSMFDLKDFYSVIARCQTELQA
jgi:hypothetical protein